MFCKKPQKKVVELHSYEMRLMMTALMHFRNKAVNAGKPVEDINALIIKLCRLSAKAHRPRRKG